MAKKTSALVIMNKQSVRKRSRGFTIVELLIVIVVIAILAAITVIAFTGMQIRAEESKLQADLKNAATQLAIDYADTGTYPANYDNLPKNEGTTYQYDLINGGTGYCITATSSRNGVPAFHTTSTNQTPQEGTCDGHHDGTPPVELTIDNAVVTTLAGSTSGYADGTGAAARFYGPDGIAVDSSGNVYVGDSSNNRIRKISPSGMVTTLAGSSWGLADGNGEAAQFSTPRGIALDSSGNVYVVDYGSHRIRKISPSGVVSTLAGYGTTGSTDGSAAAARFRSPNGVTVDSSRNVYVGDTNNHRIRKISPTQ